MAERTHSLLARTALDVDLQVNRIGRKCLAPGDMRRPKQRHHRYAEWGGKMAWSGIGADKQFRVFHRDFRQADIDGDIRQRNNTRMIRNPDNAARFVPFRGTAQNEHGFTKFRSQPAGQDAERFRRPMFGGTKRPPRVERD